LKAGFASIVISPPVATRLVGFYNERVSQAIRDDLYAKVMVLADGVQKAAIVQTDLVGLTRRRVEKVRSLVQEKTGILGDAIMVACSHTHSGPFTWSSAELPYVAVDEWLDRVYLDLLCKQISGAIGAAMCDMVEVKIGAGSGRLNGVSSNRENIGGPIDPEVGIIRIDSISSEPHAIVINYACHPIVLGCDNKYVSADYPGSAKRFIEKNTGATCFFLNGACGDINPKVHGPCDLSEAGFKSGFFNSPNWPDEYVVPRIEASEEVERLGTILGAEALKVALQVETDANGTLQVNRKDVSLPLHLPQLTKAKALLKERTELLERAEGEEKRLEYLDLLNCAKYIVRLVENEEKSMNTEIQVMRIDDIALVSEPGELFVEIGLGIKKNSPVKHTFISGYTNDYMGYIPTEKSFRTRNRPSKTDYPTREIGLTQRIHSIIETSSLQGIQETV
jgi:hypothetical protein